MRFAHRLVVIGALAAAGLGAVAVSHAPGWHGPDVHLVDGTWIGTERPCGAGASDWDLECRTIVNGTLERVVPDLRARVTRAVVADLPITFGTSSGEQRAARLEVGIGTIEAVVLDLADGSRRVIGALCTMSLVDGPTGLRLDVENSGCSPWPLNWWREGGAPPSIPPGVTFG